MALDYDYRYVYDSINPEWDGNRLVYNKDNWDTIKNDIDYDTRFTFEQHDIRYELNVRLIHKMILPTWHKLEDVLIKTCHVPTQRILDIFLKAEKTLVSLVPNMAYKTMTEQFHKNLDRFKKAYGLDDDIDPIVDKFNKTKYKSWFKNMGPNILHGTYKNAAVIIAGKFVLIHESKDLEKMKVYNEVLEESNTERVQKQIESMLTKGISGKIIDSFKTDKASLKMLIALNDRHTENDMIGIYHNEQILTEQFIPERMAYGIVPVICEVPDKVLTKALAYFDRKKDIEIRIMPYGCAFVQDEFTAYLHCSNRGKVPQFLKEIL